MNNAEIRKEMEEALMSTEGNKTIVIGPRWKYWVLLFLEHLFPIILKEALKTVSLTQVNWTQYRELRAYSTFDFTEIAAKLWILLICTSWLLSTNK